DFRLSWISSSLGILCRRGIRCKPECGVLRLPPESTIGYHTSMDEQPFDTYLRKTPRIGQGVYIARGAVVLGDVTLGDYSSVWYNAVLRGDINRIAIGHHTNIQDNAVLHLADDLPCLVGHFVTVGHSAILHACTVGDETL